jgi:hypothetical protein
MTVKAIEVRQRLEECLGEVETEDFLPHNITTITTCHVDPQAVLVGRPILRHIGCTSVVGERCLGREHHDRVAIDIGEEVVKKNWQYPKVVDMCRGFQGSLGEGW